MQGNISRRPRNNEASSVLPEKDGSREIKRGDVIIRYLTPFGVWHYGLVVDVKGQNLNDIFLLELADSTGIAKISLHQFMYERYYFWIDNFDSEIANNSTYNIDERIERAYKLYREQKLLYTLNKYNCEYFVRRCIFKNPALWISRQTKEMGKDRLAMMSKLIGTIAHGIVGKYVDISRIEFDLNSDKQGFEVCLDCGSITALPNRLAG
jgi:hypothetical protein